MKVLLLNPPAPQGFIRSGRWTRESRANQSWPPIWLAYATGFLKQKGFDVGLVDAPAKNLSYELAYLYITKLMQPNVIFYYWCFDNMKADLLFADKLAKYTKVVLVGPWSLCAPDALQNTRRVNVMTYGEFEHTALELLQTDALEEVKGIYWRNPKGEILKNAVRPLCSSEELDAMPFVSEVYDEYLNLKQYRQTSLRYPFVDLLSSRSCPHSCHFCVWVRGFQHLDRCRYRARSIKNVVDELWFIKNNLPYVKQIWFQDDTLPQKHVKELSEAILGEKLGVCWGGYSRAELDFETLRLMKESGCRTLHVGYESPIQANLDIVNKGLKVEQMKEFADNVKKLDLWSSATFMLFPWMTKKDIVFTVNWAKKIRPKRMNFIQAQGYPHTPYAETVEQLKNPKDIVENPVTLMSFEEMKHWEQWGFKQFYIYNPRFWFELLRSPSEWKNALSDAGGLLRFLKS